ncbi:MAG: hypothetical protein KKG99_09760 [Bacteroidetes bacterium]|nr:hypothetical protein [Bacteroidota bacterium]
MKNAILLIFMLLCGNLFAFNINCNVDDESILIQELNLAKVTEDVDAKVKSIRRVINKKVQRTLFSFTEDLIADLVRTSSGVYYEEMGKKVVTNNFEKLTPEQIDVLNFFLLAEAASELDRKNFLAEEDSLRLELYRDRRDKLYGALEKILEKISGISDSVIEDIK